MNDYATEQNRTEQNRTEQNRTEQNRTEQNRTDGFISIVAIGIFALLMVFGIIIQLQVMDTYQSITNNNNYVAARDIADSTLEYAQFKLKNLDPGYNSGLVTCNYENGAASDQATSASAICNDGKFLDIVGTKKVSIVVEVKGRPEQSEKIKTTKCKSGLTNFSNDCYAVPFPATGDAGDNSGGIDRCDMYKPFATGGTDKVDASLTVGLAAQIDNLDHSCNWNKLTFGSGLTDRVAIPLFYDNGDGNIVNPFKQPGGAADKFFLRIRPPCLPCGKPDPNSGVLPEGTRSCVSEQDATVCENNQRYKLDVDESPDTKDDDIVVQWQLNGECVDANGKVETCGMIAIPDVAKESAVFESFINDRTFVKGTSIMLENGTLAYDVNTSPLKPITFIKLDPTAGVLPPKLPQMSRPTLTLFLSKPLISTLKKNIPYLEYQVLTNEPIGNPKTRIEVTVTVDGNSFKKVLTKEEQKPLIDFAVHN